MSSYDYPKVPQILKHQIVGIGEDLPLDGSLRAWYFDTTEKKWNVLIQEEDSQELKP